MRAPIFIQAVLASLSFNVVAAQLSTLPSCAQTCVANMLNQATSLGCTSASDTACLCASSSFTAGSKDCTSQSCGAEQLAQVNTYFTNMCSASAAAATTTGAATSAAVSTAVVGVATTSSVPGAATTPGAATGTTTAPAGAATTAGVVGIGSNSTMTTSVRTSSASSTSSSGAAHTPVTTSSSFSSSSSETNSDKDSSDAKKSTGLSSAAKAGIGVSVGAVAVSMIVITGVFVFKKNRGISEYNNDKMNSSPMASAGSQFGYSSTQQRLSDSGGELKATRYEDMVSQAAPRTMV